MRDQSSRVPTILSAKESYNDAADVGNQRLALSIREACAAAGVRRTTLYKIIGNGDLRAVKCGNRTLILLDDLSRWLRTLPAVRPLQSVNAASLPDPEEE